MGWTGRRGGIGRMGERSRSSSWSWSRARTCLRSSKGCGQRARASPRRSAADREADRRGARGGARAGHHPSRSEAREHQGARGRHRQGPRLRPREGRRAGRQRASNVSHSPTITTPAMMTGVGMILGTAAYMAPSRRVGKRVDKRADIWAFGCVLYEMLACTSARLRATMSRTCWRRC